MADSTLAALTAASTPLDGTELLYGTQGGADRKFTTDSIADLVTPGIGGSTGATDNAILRADGAGGVTAQAGAPVTISDNGLITDTIGAANTGLLASTGYSLTGSDATNAIDISGTWNTSGSPRALKISITNTASGGDARLIDLLSSAVTRFAVYADGKVRIGEFSSDNARLYAETNGTFQIGGAWGGVNDNQTVLVGTGKLVLGGGGSIASVAVPSNTIDLKTGSSTTGLQINRGTAKLTSYTVATLPAAATVGAGAIAFVTDATTPTSLATVVGGGAVKVPVYSDGSGWLVM